MGGTYVVKVGSGLLTKKDGSRDTEIINSIVEQISTLTKAGNRFVLVTSGAVAGDPNKSRSKNLRATVGGISLIREYNESFKKKDQEMAYILVRDNDLTGFWFWAKRFFSRSLSLIERVILEAFREEVVVVLNQNDATSNTQIKALNRCADNDVTAMLVTLLPGLKVDGLITLIDAKGVIAPNGAIVQDVRMRDYKKIISYANGGSELGYEKNGMKTKIETMCKVAKKGKDAMIVPGREHGSIEEAINTFEKEISTFQSMTCQRRGTRFFPEIYF